MLCADENLTIFNVSNSVPPRPSTLLFCCLLRFLTLLQFSLYFWLSRYSENTSHLIQRFVCECTVHFKKEKIKKILRKITSWKIKTKCQTQPQQPVFQSELK